MLAIRVHEFGDASHLLAEDLPVPQPKAGEVRVKIAATGLNFTDIYQRKGLYPNPLPFTVGGEFAGVVDAVGAEAQDLWQVGDRVGTAGGVGGYAEYGMAAASRLVAVPAAISLEQAAAVLLQGMTAHYLAFSTYPLKAGDTCLVHAAAGGVGLLLVQLAKHCGARVIGTVSTEEKAQLAREAGADEIILYTQTDFEAETRRLTGGKGVDVVYDSVGKTTFLKGFNVLKPCGMMVLYGQSSGPVDPIDQQLLNTKGSLFLTRPTLGAYTLGRDALMKRASDLFGWMASIQEDGRRKLTVRIDRTFRLKDAAAAQTYMEERATRGKVLLIP